MLEIVGLEALGDVDESADPEAERLAREREKARRVGDYELADRLRDRIATLGFTVRDTADGPRLVRR